jgi:hypothetical protein
MKTSNNKNTYHTGSIGVHHFKRETYPHEDITDKLLITTDFLDMLIVTQLVKKFPASYGTQRLITMFTGLATGPYPDTDEYSLQLPTLFL